MTIPKASKKENVKMKGDPSSDTIYKAQLVGFMKQRFLNPLSTSLLTRAPVDPCLIVYKAGSISITFSYHLVRLLHIPYSFCKYYLPDIISKVFTHEK